MATPSSTRTKRKTVTPASAESPRILGTHVGAVFPKRGAVTALIYGEAPGPRGADKSGIPFFGDKSGILVYRTLIETGRCTLNADIDEVRWDGQWLKANGVRPTFIETALSNAFPVCPTDDGHSFRAPNKKELGSEENVTRVEKEIARAKKRGLRAIVVLGRHADWLLGVKLGLREQTDIAYSQISHPSPLGLMWLKRQRGGTTRMKDLEQEWMHRFREMIQA
jgi:uracil-DNA glycosylase